MIIPDKQLKYVLSGGPHDSNFVSLRVGKPPTQDTQLHEFVLVLVLNGNVMVGLLESLKVAHDKGELTQEQKDWLKSFMNNLVEASLSGSVLE